jgi:hypothetical protein
MKKTIRNLREVQRVLSDPSVFPTIKDDYREEVHGAARELLAREDAIVLMPNEDTIVTFYVLNASLVSMHICCIQGEYRKQIGKYVIDAMDYLFSRATTVNKMIAMIPECNRLPRLLAGSMGMDKEGLITEGFKRDGKYHDIHIFGTTRDKFYNKYKDRR